MCVVLQLYHMHCPVFLLSLLTLGVDAQRGLRYLDRECVCVCE